MKLFRLPELRGQLHVPNILAAYPSINTRMSSVVRDTRVFTGNHRDDAFATRVQEDEKNKLFLHHTGVLVFAEKKKETA